MHSQLAKNQLLKSLEEHASQLKRPGVVRWSGGVRREWRLSSARADFWPDKAGRRRERERAAESNKFQERRVGSLS
jgi:hypothetical protein